MESLAAAGEVDEPGLTVADALAADAALGRPAPQPGDPGFGSSPSDAGSAASQHTVVAW